MSPADENGFRQWLRKFARERGLWVLSNQEILRAAFTAGINRRDEGTDND
jgi:hypothetical protein